MAHKKQVYVHPIQVQTKRPPSYDIRTLEALDWSEQWTGKTQDSI